MASQKTKKYDPSQDVPEGHTNTVYSVAFSPGGNSVVSGSRDKTIRTWHVHQESLIGSPAAMKGHRDWIWAVSYSPLGDVIASGSGDKTIRLWDVNTGRQLGEPMKSDYPIRSVAFSPDAKLIASATDSGSARFDPAAKLVQVWDIQMRTVEPFKGHTNWVTSAAFSPDGNWLVSSSFDKTIRLWDIQHRGTTFGLLEGHTNYVYSAIFSPDGSQIASCSKDCTLRLWDIRSGSIIDKPYAGHTDLVWSVAFSPDGTYLVSGGYDQTVRLWDIRTGRQINQPFREHTGSVHSVAFSPCGRYIASGSHDRKVILRDVSSKASEVYGDPHGTPSFSKVDTKHSRTSWKVNLLESGQKLNEETSALIARIRNVDRLDSDFINQVGKHLDMKRELLEKLHLADMRNDSSHLNLLDTWLSPLVILASSLNLLPKSQNSREYFHLGKRSLMIVTTYLPKSSPARPTVAWFWGNFYFNRFLLFENKNHINQSIKFRLQSIQLMPDNGPLAEKHRHLIGLVRAYVLRFEYYRSAEDLERAIEYSSEAWKNIQAETEGAEAAKQDSVLNEMSKVLKRVDEHLVELNSVSLTNTGIREWSSTLYDFLKHDETRYHIKASCMRTLGLLYITRFDQLGGQHPRDLENGLAFLTASVALLPNDHTMDLFSALLALADSLVKLGDKVHFELAYEFLVLARRLGSTSPSLHNSLCDFHMALSRQEADSSHLEEAMVSCAIVVVHISPPGSKFWVKAQQKLALCKIYKYNDLRAEGSPLAIEALEFALHDFMIIALSPCGHLFDKFTAACSWATNAASHPAFQAHALYGYEAALELIPLVACFDSILDHRRKAIQKAGRLATEAAAIAIKENDYSLALTLLEQGRSAKWNHMLQLQSPDTLSLHPQGERLAKHLEEIMKELQPDLDHVSIRKEQLSDLQSRYRDVLAEIREIPGFAYFMRSKSIEELAKAARNGPVVAINVHESRCDALIVHPLGHSTSVQHIPLPDLSPGHIIQMRDIIDQSLEKISNGRKPPRGRQKPPGTTQLEAELKKLWYRVVQPILVGLGYKPRRTSHLDLPRITWCPTGPLSFLPLHAAGDYDRPQNKAFTFEYVVSSYAPTLSSLVPDSHYDVLPEPSYDILMVNPGTSLGGATLAGAKTELNCITYHFNAITGVLGLRPIENLYLDQISESASTGSGNSQAQASQFALDMDGVSDDESDQDSKIRHPQNQSEVCLSMRLEGPNITPEKVYEEMQKRGWLHLACHAVQNDSNPAKCGFYLGDELLSLQKIAQMPYKKRGLAFLSACRTAKGDQNLPDEAIHLASGMLMTGYSSVITTLWPVRGTDTPFIADIVYGNLLMKDGMECHRSAVALHEALDKLRQEPGVRLSDWISFVHFGA